MSLDNQTKTRESEAVLEGSTINAFQEFNLWRVDIKTDFEKASLQTFIQIFCW